MKKIINHLLLLSMFVSLSCKKKDNSESEAASTTSTSTTGSAVQSPETEMDKFLKVMTGGDIKPWNFDLIDSLGNNQTSGSKYVFTMSSSTTAPIYRPDPNNPSVSIIDKINGVVSLKGYMFAANSYTPNHDFHWSVYFEDGKPAKFNDFMLEPWKMTAFSSNQFSAVNISGKSWSNGRNMALTPGTVPVGFVPPSAPSTNPTQLCIIGNWKKTTCNVTAYRTITSTGTGKGTCVLTDTDCSGTYARKVCWTWTESAGKITWHYTCFDINGEEQNPFPADEVTPYTCNGNTLMFGGTTWTRQ